MKLDERIGEYIAARSRKNPEGDPLGTVLLLACAVCFLFREVVKDMASKIRERFKR